MPEPEQETTSVVLLAYWVWLPPKNNSRSFPSQEANMIGWMNFSTSTLSILLCDK